MQERILKTFLEEKSRNVDAVMDSLYRYFNLLCKANKNVNLISRKTPIQDYWTVHFLDSIIPTCLFDFAGKKILDLGTGGGLPGIPLKMLYPTSEMYLLDSIQKKNTDRKKYCQKT